MFGQIGIFVVTMLAIFLMYFDLPAFARARWDKSKPIKLMSGPELLFNDGQVAYREKRHRDAVRMLKHAALIRPERAITHYYLGLSYAALGAFAEAENAYQEALRRDPKSNAAWSELGDLYRRLNRWEDAVDAYQRALRIKPDLAAARVGLEAASACLGNKQAT
jgi:tetratricopeptide (TPR) repeat protein